MLWTEDVPKVEKANSLSICRTPPKGRIGGIVTSEGIVGCFTHYWGGRTVPCEGQVCEACSQGIGNRWHGYVSVYNAKLRKHFLFEFTNLAAESFVKYQELMGKLRGCMFYAERNGIRNNSPVTITCSPANLDGVALPTPPDVKRVLGIIWGLGANAMKKDGAYAYSELVEPDQEFLENVEGPARRPSSRRKKTA